VVAGTVAATSAGAAAPASGGTAHFAVGWPRSLSSATRPGQLHGCDPIGTVNCLIPFPYDYYTVDDWASHTGERIAFTSAMMPGQRGRSAHRPDGMEPRRRLLPRRAPILTVLPGVNLTASYAAPITMIHPPATSTT
jgi:hypothetical protein